MAFQKKDKALADQGRLEEMQHLSASEAWERFLWLEIGWGLSKNLSFLRIFLILATQTIQPWNCMQFSSLFDFPLFLKIFLH